MRDYKQVFHALTLPALLLERFKGDYIIKDINKAFASAFFSEEKKVIGKRISQIFPSNSEQHRKSLERIHTSLEKVVSSSIADSIKIMKYDIFSEFNNEFEERYWQIENIPIKDHDTDEITCLQSMFIERTSEMLHKQAKHELEAKLLERLEKERHFVESNSDGLYSLDTEGKFLSANKGLIEITETPEEELLQMSFIRFCTSHHKHRILGFFNKALNGENQHFEADFISAKGREMTLNISIVPFKEQKEIAGVYGIAKDVTQLKESENALIKSEKKYRAMIEEGFDLISILDSEGRFKFVSGASLHLFGFSPEDFIGKSCFDWVHHEEKERITRDFFNLKLGKQVQYSPYRIQDIDGNWRWIETKATNLLDDPNVGGIVTNSREVTELIEISDERDQIYQRYNLAAAATRDLIYDWNLRTDEVIRFSKGSKTIFGYPAEVVNNREFWENNIHPEEIEGLKKTLYQTLEDPEMNLIKTQYRMRRANGTFAHLIDRGNILRDEKGKAIRIVGATTDISGIIKSKNDLKLANKRFHYAMKATKEMIWDWDIVNDYVLRGNSFLQLYGYNIKEKPTFSNFWISKIHENDRDEVVKSLQEALKDIQKNKWSQEYSFRKVNGDRAYVIDRGYIIRDATGKAIRMVGATLDVTESRRLLKKIESQNKILKEVAWEQSHIVRAPLARLKALSALLEEEVFEVWDREELMRLIKESADELDDIIAGIIKKTEEIEFK